LQKNYLKKLKPEITYFDGVNQLFDVVAPDLEAASARSA
jgi:hypothetical protein